MCITYKTQVKLKGISLRPVFKMRAPLIIPTENEFLVLFQHPQILKKGGALSDIETFKSPIFYQRGSGIFSLLKGIGRRVLPFIIKNVMPEAVDLGRGIFQDVGSGKKNFRESLKHRGLAAVKGVARRATGGRVKKKKKRGKRRICNNKKDVFQLV